jgi:hypothetical protein
MRSRQERSRSRLGFESLEGRVALSGMGVGGLDDGPNHHRGRDAVEVRRADDRADHDAGDDNLARHSGLDERAGHDVADDNLPRHSGKDDGSGHR